MPCLYLVRWSPNIVGKFPSSDQNVIHMGHFLRSHRESLFALNSCSTQRCMYHKLFPSSSMGTKPTGLHIQKAYTSLGTSSMQILLLSAHACMHIA